jgi:hypothetical protein
VPGGGVTDEGLQDVSKSNADSAEEKAHSNACMVKSNPLIYSFLLFLFNYATAS